MSKKVYVNGGIIVNTRYFTCNNATCLCKEIPIDAEYIDPPMTKDGKCLVIDDQHPQSLFNDYYCKTFFSSLYKGCDYLSMSNDDCFKEFCIGIEEARKLIAIDYMVTEEVGEVYCKMIYLHVISCFDAYISSLILSIIAHNESLFIKFYKKLVSSQKKAEISDFLITGEHAKWEQEIIKYILHMSFCNMKTIKECFSTLGLKLPRTDHQAIKDHFSNRHLLMHRNGKKLLNERLTIDKNMVLKAIYDIYTFVEAI